MAGVSSAMVTSFKSESWQALHNFANPGGNTFKIALFRATASIVGTYGAATTNYSDMTGNSDEASGAGYSAGGNTLAAVTPTTSGTTAYTDFVDSTWSSATITSCGALIYNSTNANRAVAVISFGADQTSTAGNFTIIFPTPDVSNAILRFS